MRMLYKKYPIIQKFLQNFEPVKTWSFLERFEMWCLLDRGQEFFPVKVEDIESRLQKQGVQPTNEILADEINSKISEYFSSDFSNYLYLKLGGKLKTLNINFSRHFSSEKVKTEATIIVRANTTNIEFSNGCFLELYLNRGVNLLTNCRIRNLNLEGPDRVEVNNCTLGNLIFGVTSIENLILLDSKIQNIEIEHPDNCRAISKQADIRNTRFETSKKHSFIFKDAQSFRFLRMNFDRLQNTILSNLMKTLEYRADRPKEPKFTRWINWFYDFCSEYGTNTTRPFLILIGLWVVQPFHCFYLTGERLVGAMIPIQVGEAYF